MSWPNAPFFCANHQNLPTGRFCADCGRPFCESCLTEMGGQPLCGWCRDQRLQVIQQRPTAKPEAVLLAARIFNAVVLLAVLLIVGFYGLMLYFPMAASVANGPDGAAGSRTVSLIFLSIGAGIVLLNALMYLPPLFGLGPGRAWSWTWQLVTLILTIVGGCLTFGGLGSLLALPAIVLLLFWVKPEVRDYCGAGR
jgi:hypothetical protein